MFFRQFLLSLALAALLQAQVVPSPPNILSQLSLCAPNSCCDSNTIQVSGSATIQGTPDQAIIEA